MIHWICFLLGHNFIAMDNTQETHYHFCLRCGNEFKHTVQKEEKEIIK